MTSIITTAVFSLIALGIISLSCWVHQPAHEVRTVDVHRLDNDHIKFTGDFSVKLDVFSAMALHHIKYNERIRITQTVSRSGRVIDTTFHNVAPLL